MRAVHVAVLAFLVTASVLPGLVQCLQRWHVLDVPSGRSSHDTPTPRGGGIAVVAGLGAGVLAAGPPGAVGTVAGVTAVAMVGAVDDLRGLPARPRLVGTWVAAAALLDALHLSGVVSTGPALPVVLAGAVWITTVVNAANFMDGVNGMSGTTAVVAGAGYALLGVLAGDPLLVTVAAALAGAGLGFLPFNAPRARVFLGDVGSYALGATLGLLSLLALDAGLPLEAAVAPLLVYGVDTGTTLLRRWRSGAALTEAHREHVYQRLGAMGLSHLEVTAVVAAAASLATGVGALSLAGLRVPGLVGLLAVAALYLAAPRLAGGAGLVPAGGHAG